jgi:hypothetical protein
MATVESYYLIPLPALSTLFHALSLVLYLQVNP